MIGYREPKSIIDAKAVGSKVIVKSYFVIEGLWDLQSNGTIRRTFN